MEKAITIPFIVVSIPLSLVLLLFLMLLFVLESDELSILISR